MVRILLALAREQQHLLDYKMKEYARISGYYLNYDICLTKASKEGRNPLGLLNLLIIKKL